MGAAGKNAAHVIHEDIIGIIIMIRGSPVIRDSKQEMPGIEPGPLG